MQADSLKVDQLIQGRRAYANIIKCTQFLELASLQLATRVPSMNYKLRTPGGATGSSMDKAHSADCVPLEVCTV